MKTYSLYFASPFFNPEQVEREERLKAHLRNMGFKVFSPKENSHLKKDASIKEQEDTFQQNLEGIRNTDAVFAITNGLDAGTLWEAGFAYGISKPVIYYAENLKGQFNLMLARSGNLVYLNMNDISAEEIINAIENHISIDYQGDIE